MQSARTRIVVMVIGAMAVFAALVLVNWMVTSGMLTPNI